MPPIERLGAFYLGKEFDPVTGVKPDAHLQLDARDLTTHAVCVGMTGSGKTGLCIALLEEAALDGVPAIIARTGYTGEDGFEAYVAPADAPRMWRKLLEAGREFEIMPVGLGARDTLRFEACMALYGNDIDDTTTPFEAGLDWIVKLDKESFLGREALVRQQAAGIKRKLVGFEMKGRGIARHGYPIWSGGSEVGIVTSGTHAPTLGKPLGLGYVPVELSEPGSKLEIEIREQKVAAQVVETPFYRRAR